MYRFTPAGPKRGDVIFLTRRFEVDLGDVQIGFSAGRGNVAAVLVLGYLPKSQTENFSAEQVLRSLGWVPANEQTKE